MVQAFPPSPIDLKSSLPTQATLPKDAKLSDVMGAHLADSQAFQDAVSEVRVWRKWWADQAGAWGKK